MYRRLRSVFGPRASLPSNMDHEGADSKPLLVTVEGAKLPSDVSKHSERAAFVVCEVTGKLCSRRKTELRDMSNLVWNEVLEIHSWLPGESLSFCLMLQDNTQYNNIFGRVVVDSHDFHPAGFSGEMPLRDPECAYGELPGTPVLTLSISAVSEELPELLTAEVESAAGGVAITDNDSSSAARSEVASEATKDTAGIGTVGPSLRTKTWPLQRVERQVWSDQIPATSDEPPTAAAGAELVLDAEEPSQQALKESTVASSAEATQSALPREVPIETAIVLDNDIGEGSVTVDTTRSESLVEAASERAGDDVAAAAASAAFAREEATGTETIAELVPESVGELATGPAETIAGALVAESAYVVAASNATDVTPTGPALDATASEAAIGDDTGQVFVAAVTPKSARTVAAGLLEKVAGAPVAESEPFVGGALNMADAMPAGPSLDTSATDAAAPHAGADDLVTADALCETPGSEEPRRRQCAEDQDRQAAARLAAFSLLPLSSKGRAPSWSAGETRAEASSAPKPLLPIRAVSASATPLPLPLSARKMETQTPRETSLKGQSPGVVPKRPAIFYASPRGGAELSSGARAPPCTPMKTEPIQEAARNKHAFGSKEGECAELASLPSIAIPVDAEVSDALPTFIETAAMGAPSVVSPTASADANGQSRPHSATSTLQSQSAHCSEVSQYSAEAVPGCGKKALHVTLIGARYLRHPDAFAPGGMAEPCALVEIPGKPDAKVQTKVLQNDVHPVWNYDVFVTDWVVGDAIVVSIWDKEPVNKVSSSDENLGLTVTFDECIGRVTLQSDQFYPRGFGGIIELQDQKGAGDPAAALVIHIESLMADDSPGTSQGTTPARASLLQEQTSFHGASPPTRSRRGSLAPSERIEFGHMSISATPVDVSERGLGSDPGCIGSPCMPILPSMSGSSRGGSVLELGEAREIHQADRDGENKAAAEEADEAARGTQQLPEEEVGGVAASSFLFSTSDQSVKSALAAVSAAVNAASPTVEGSPSNSWEIPAEEAEAGAAAESPVKVEMDQVAATDDAYAGPPTHDSEVIGEAMAARWAAKAAQEAAMLKAAHPISPTGSWEMPLGDAAGRQAAEPAQEVSIHQHVSSASPATSLEIPALDAAVKVAAEPAQEVEMHKAGTDSFGSLQGTGSLSPEAAACNDLNPGRGEQFLLNVQSKADRADTSTERDRIVDVAGLFGQVNNENEPKYCDEDQPISDLGGNENCNDLLPTEGPFLKAVAICKDLCSMGGHTFVQDLLRDGSAGDESALRCLLLECPEDVACLKEMVEMNDQILSGMETPLVEVDASSKDDEEDGLDDHNLYGHPELTRVLTFAAAQALKWLAWHEAWYACLVRQASGAKADSTDIAVAERRLLADEARHAWLEATKEPWSTESSEPVLTEELAVAIADVTGACSRHCAARNLEPKCMAEAASEWNVFFDVFQELEVEGEFEREDENNRGGTTRGRINITKEIKWLLWNSSWHVANLLARDEDRGGGGDEDQDDEAVFGPNYPGVESDPMTNMVHFVRHTCTLFTGDISETPSWWNGICLPSGITETEVFQSAASGFNVVRLRIAMPAEGKVTAAGGMLVSLPSPSDPLVSVRSALSAARYGGTQVVLDLSGWSLRSRRIVEAVGKISSAAVSVDLLVAIALPCPTTPAMASAMVKAVRGSGLTADRCAIILPLQDAVVNDEGKYCGQFKKYLDEGAGGILMTDGRIIFEAVRSLATPSGTLDSPRPPWKILDVASHSGDDVDEWLPVSCARFTLELPGVMTKNGEANACLMNGPAWREELAARFQASASATTHGWFAVMNDRLGSLPECLTRQWHWPDPELESVIWPTGRHVATLIYMHGFTCDGNNYMKYPEYFYRNGGDDLDDLVPNAGLKVVLPTAPVLPITAYGGDRIRAWYDYLTDHGGEQEDIVDEATLEATTNRIHMLLNQEIAHLGGDSSRVFLGGASQGCCTALHVAMTYNGSLGGLVATQGHLMSLSTVPSDWSSRNTPIRIFHGLADDTMPWESWVSDTYDPLRNTGADVSDVTSAGVDHGDEKAEGQWIRTFLAEMMARFEGEADIFSAGSEDFAQFLGITQGASLSGLLPVGRLMR
eukprot:TRINITY_DN40316_c0_g1_i1.p1 TRINITY_DN40316_c0_g1~~TRINITY_DN40316_c0_g1_i1.p1  ORF type:complete len:2101 (-),score=404.85 TRINITY_DN40316_c0_g1_i1:205-6507(-)